MGKDKKEVDIDNLTGFNMKTRKKEKILDPVLTTMKNGRKAVKGHGKDGTKMFRII